MADAPGDACVANQVLVDIAGFPPVRTPLEVELAATTAVEAMNVVVAAGRTSDATRADADTVAPAVDTIESEIAAHVDDSGWWNQRDALVPIIADPPTRTAFERLTAATSAGCPDDDSTTAPTTGPTTTAPTTGPTTTANGSA